MTDAPQIFLSYRRKDSADITDRIYDRLVGHFGKESVFRDINAIPLAVNFHDRIDQMLSRCRVMLVVIGPVWASITDEAGRHRLNDPGDPVRVEVETALERNIPVVPLFVGGATVPKKNELPRRLKGLPDLNGMFIRPDPDFDNDFRRLINELGRYLPDFEKPSVAPIPAPPPAISAEDPVAEFIRKVSTAESIGKVVLAEIISFALMMLSFWITRDRVPPIATLDEVIRYALSYSVVFALLLASLIGSISFGLRRAFKEASAKKLVNLAPPGSFFGWLEKNYVLLLIATFPGNFLLFVWWLLA